MSSVDETNYAVATVDAPGYGYQAMLLYLSVEWGREEVGRNLEQVAVVPGLLDTQEQRNDVRRAGT